MPPFRRIFPLLLIAIGLAAACSDNNDFGDPTEFNVLDTVTLGALEGTSIATPSGYNIAVGALRTDQSVDFEFAYNIRRLEDGSYQRVFLPRAALGLSGSNANPGLQRRNEAFDAITRAPSNGYVSDSAVPVQVGERYLVRSRVICGNLGVPLYGKLEILSFQDSMVTFQTLVNQNCGYKDLLPGLPKN
ncbi:MAG TPA: hypothetical protein VMY76_04020 [Gemmatimonadales bacterium]|nr:hypothetical protein [Gemmatimonadales bacterium]